MNSSGLDKYAGGIAPRNEFNSDWWSWYDLRIEQELPGFFGSDKFLAFVTVKNLCNLINSEWCVLYEAGFPRTQSIVDMDVTDDGSQYIFQEYIEAPGQGRVTDASLWKIRIGLSYRF